MRMTDDDIQALADTAEVVSPHSAARVVDLPSRPEAIAQRRDFGALDWRDIRTDLRSDYLIKGFLDADTLAVIYGESGCGKSFFTLDLALRVALGWQWNGRRVRRGGVVYVAAEGGRGLTKRIEAFRREHRDTAGTPGHFENVSFTLIPTAPGLGADGDQTDALIAEFKAAEQRTGVRVRLVVLDTLSRCFGSGDENSSEAMGCFVRNCDRIRQATGACVLIVHHAGKDTTKGARGHSLLRAAVDTEMLIEPGRDTGTDGTAADCPVPSRAKITKQKDGEGAEFGFRLRQVTLGEDQDGDPVTSCVIEETEVPTRKAARMSPRDALAVEALRELIIKHGVELPPGTRFPTAGQQLGVEVSRYREAFCDKVLSGTPRDTAKKAFQRTREKLQAAGIIAISGDWVWLPGHRDITGTFRKCPAGQRGET